MKKIVSIILILLGIGLGYVGFTDLQDSSASVEIGEFELGVEDSSSKNQAYIMLGLGVLSVLIGAGLLAKSK